MFAFVCLHLLVVQLLLVIFCLWLLRKNILYQNFILWKTVVEMQLGAASAFWTTTSMCKSCRIFSSPLQGMMMDVLFVCLFVTQWDWRWRWQPHRPLQGTQNTSTKESVRVWWTLFWRQKQTLRPSCFSGGCDTEEPAAPPRLPHPSPSTLLRHNRLTAAQRAPEMWRPSARTHRGPRDTNWRVKPCDFLLSFSCVCGLKGAANERRHCGRAANAFSLFVSPRRRTPPAGGRHQLRSPRWIFTTVFKKMFTLYFYFFCLFCSINGRLKGGNKQIENSFSNFNSENQNCSSHSLRSCHFK